MFKSFFIAGILLLCLHHQIQAQEPLKPNNKSALIQVAILLDVSNSMDGLINQAKSELWGVINEVAKARKNGESPELEIAIYDYGKSSHPVDNGYVRKVLDFTGDLDTLSEVLFSLSTNGGDEYCGTVIKTAVNDLLWQNKSDQYRVIFIAGNEPFTQGKVNYQHACLLAKEKNIYINTIHCGDEQTGITEKWKDGAKQGMGEYFFINSNTVDKYIASPYDSIIDRLNQELNATYWGYGAAGSRAKENQMRQDDNNMGLSKAAYYERAKSKVSSKSYQKSAAKWDVISRANTDSTFIYVAKDEELPEQLKGKRVEEKKAIVQYNTAKRDSISKALQEYGKLRDDYVAVQRKREANENKLRDDSLGRAIAKAIRLQASSKGFVFED